MRLVFRVLVLVTMILCMNAGNLFAGLSFQHQLSFTVPGLTGSISQMKFADIDHDGFPEVLASNSSQAVLYSITHDSILMSVTPDSGYYIRSIELADVNRDSIIDVVVASAQTRDLIFSPFGYSLHISMWQIKCYSGSSGFQDISTDSLQDNAYSVSKSILHAGDFDDDGYNELLFSVDSAGLYSNESLEWYQVWTEGGSRFYNSFPDSIHWHREYLLSGLGKISLHDGSHVFLTERYTYAYDVIPAFPNNESDYYTLGLLQKTGNFIPIATAPFSTTQSCSDDQVNFYSSQFCTVGEFDSDPVTTELLVTHFYHYACMPVFFDSTKYEMSMYHLTSSGTTDMLWSKDIKGKDYNNFVYHPDLPGYFFAFSYDTLLLFRGTDGSIHSSLTSIPSGTRYWDFSFDDQEPRLVVRNGNQVAFYKLDVATGIEDNSAPTVPSTFALGKPYPNPFNPELSIPITVGNPGTLTVDIFNITGQKVKTLHDGDVKAGNLVYHWDGSSFGSGVYLVRAQFGAETRTVKVMLLK